MEFDCERNGKRWRMGVERNIYLPCSTKNPRKRNFFSPGMVLPLPGGIAPLESNTERRIVFALMSELNKNFGLQLDPFPSLEHGVVTQTDKATTNRYIVVPLICTKWPLTCQQILPALLSQDSVRDCRPVGVSPRD